MNFLLQRITEQYLVVTGMADTCYMNLDSEVFDDQIVPDTDDCFLPPTEAPLPSGSWNPNVSVLDICFIFLKLISVNENILKSVQI